MHNEPMVTAFELFERVSNEPALSHNIHMIPMRIPRRLFIETWLGWEHDLALEAGMCLQASTADYVGPTLPRIPDMHEGVAYYRDVAAKAGEWLRERDLGPGRDNVTVTIPITHDLLATVDKWCHWTLVELGRYAERVVSRFHESMGDGEEAGIREEWERIYPDCV